MTENSSNEKQDNDLEMLKLFRERQDAEATLHWSRNSYFLVVMSILLIARAAKSHCRKKFILLF